MESQTKPDLNAPFKNNSSPSDLDEDSPQRRPKRGSGGAAHPCCQVERCAALLSDSKKYHRRHKVCEFHAKAQFVVLAGLRQRFCQQCSRFHEVSEFDEAKRSCRRRLAGHNERRRKGSASEGAGEGRSDERVRLMGHPITGPNTTSGGAPANYKLFQIR